MSKIYFALCFLFCLYLYKPVNAQTELSNWYLSMQDTLYTKANQNINDFTGMGIAKASDFETAFRYAKIQAETDMVDRINLFLITAIKIDKNNRDFNFSAYSSAKLPPDRKYRFVDSLSVNGKIHVAVLVEASKLSVEDNMPLEANIPDYAFMVEPTKTTNQQNDSLLNWEEEMEKKAAKLFVENYDDFVCFAIGTGQHFMIAEKQAQMFAAHKLPAKTDIFGKIFMSFYSKTKNRQVIENDDEFNLVALSRKHISDFRFNVFERKIINGKHCVAGVVMKNRNALFKDYAKQMNMNEEETRKLYSVVNDEFNKIVARDDYDFNVLNVSDDLLLAFQDYYDETITPEKRKQMKMLYENYKKQMAESDSRKKKIEKLWDSNEESDLLREVVYSDKYKTKRVIDYDKGTIEIDMILSENEINNKEYINKAIENSLGEFTGFVVDKDNENKIVDDRESKNKKKLTLKIAPDYIKKMADKYMPLIEKYANKYNLDPELVCALIETESYYNPNAVSHANAIGLMQIVPHSGGRHSYRHVYDIDTIPGVAYLKVPENNVLLGCAYLDVLYKTFAGVKNDVSRMYCVICAYNTGPGNVSRTFTGKRVIPKAVNEINKYTPDALYKFLKTNLPYSETRKYIVKVTEKLEKYRKWNRK